MEADNAILKLCNAESCKNSPEECAEVMKMLFFEWNMCLVIIKNYEKQMEKMQKELNFYRELELLKEAMNAAIEGDNYEYNENKYNEYDNEYDYENEQ